MTTHADIVICGGSLAGLACALRLKQLGYDPLVLEKSRFPRAKLCGEFLGPDSFASLKRLGALELIQAESFGPIEHVFFHAMHGQALNIHMRWMHREFPYALAIPRSKLDFLLMQQARQAGLTVLEGHRILPAIQYNATQFQLKVQPQTTAISALQHYVTPWFIDASGRHGRLFIEKSSPKMSNRTQFSRSYPSGVSATDVVGIQCHVQLPKPVERPDLHMVLFPGGYGGIQPISETTANVCMLVEPRLARLTHLPFPEFIQATLGRNPNVTRWLHDCIRESAFCTTANLNLNLQQEECMPVLRIGDARITVDPFTGSGMAHALETGILAAETVHETRCRQKSYIDAVQRYKDRYNRTFKNRLTLLKLFRPAMFSQATQRIIWPLLPKLAPTLTRLFR